MLERAKKKLEGDLSSALESISQLKDELLTTSRSYEDQLRWRSQVMVTNLGREAK